MVAETEAIRARIAASVARDEGPGLESDVPPPTPEEDVGIGQHSQSGAEPADAPQSRSRSLAEILQTPDALKPPDVVVPGLAWEGRLTLVSAREGLGKSTLFQAAAAAVTTGGEFLGQRCRKGPVLWVLVEEHVSDLAIRAVRFQTAPEQFYILDRPDDPLNALRAEVGYRAPVLGIVDTVHRFAVSQLGPEGKVQWAEVMAVLDNITRGGKMALVMSAQAVKATGEYRDSSEIGHGVDVVLNLTRPDKDSPVRKLERQKARWPLEDVSFELVGDTYRLGGTVAKKLSKQRQKVLDALEPPMTYSEWHEASGVPPSTFKRALGFLLKTKHVERGADESYRHTEAHKAQVGPADPTVPEPVVGPPLPTVVDGGVGPTAGVGHGEPRQDPDTEARIAMREGA